MPTTTTTVTTAEASGVTTTVTTTEATPSAPVAAPAAKSAPAVDATCAGLLLPSATAEDITGKVALVTGASKGIGRQCAEALAAKGARVVCVARSEGLLKEVVETITAAGGTANFFCADLTDEESIKGMFAHAKATFGLVDLVFANAGGAGDMDKEGLPMAHEYNAAKLRRLFAINQDAVFLTFVHFYPHCVENGGGTFVGNASITAALPDAVLQAGGGGPGSATVMAYTASKAAVTDMCRSIHAGYFKSHNIRSYSVNPALFASELVKNFCQVNADSEGRPYEELAEDKVAVMDGAAMLFNPVYPNKVGNPKHIGAFLVAVMNNSTLWPSGSAVAIDGDCTFSLEELQKRVHRSVDVEKGHKWYNVDHASVRDVTGRHHPAGYVEGLPGFTGASPIHNVALNK